MGRCRFLRRGYAHRGSLRLEQWGQPDARRERLTMLVRQT
jgi:hypothetical protein